MRELERALGPGRRARDLALALSLGSEAIEAEEPEAALPYLLWAKHEAPRAAVVREALGVALYLVERWGEALSELAAYRRMTGRVDQNHLVADCLRAQGRELERVLAPVRELAAAERAPLDRRAEAVIVGAGAIADEGDVTAARSLVAALITGRRASLALGEGPAIAGFDAPDEARARALWLAATLAERDGAPGEAVAALDRLLALDPEFPDARAERERLSRSA